MFITYLLYYYFIMFINVTRNITRNYFIGFYMINTNHITYSFFILFFSKFSIYFNLANLIILLLKLSYRVDKIKMTYIS